MSMVVGGASTSFLVVRASTDVSHYRPFPDEGNSSKMFSTFCLIDDYVAFADHQFVIILRQIANESMISTALQHPQKLCVLIA